jgi:hypothetical protein
VDSLRLGLHDALAQAAVSLRIPPATQLCAGNRSVLLGIAPLLWPLIMYALHLSFYSTHSITLPQPHPQNWFRAPRPGVVRRRRVHRRAVRVQHRVSVAGICFYPTFLVVFLTMGPCRTASAA